MRVLLGLLRQARGHRRQLLLAAVLSATTYACGVALMGSAAWLLSRAAEHPNASALTLAAVAVRALGLGRGVARYADRLVGHQATLRVVADLRVSVFQALVRRPAGAERSGDVLSSVVADVEAVQDLWVRCLIPFTAAGLVTTGSVAACWWWLPEAGLVLLVGLTTALVVVPVLAAGGARREQAVAQLRATYQVQALDVVQGCADLLVHGALPEALDQAEKGALALARLDRRGALRAGLVTAATALLQGATALAVAAVALPAVQSGALPRVGLAVVVLISLAAFEPMLPLVDAGGLLPRCWGAATRLSVLLEDQPEVRARPLKGDATHLRLCGAQVRRPGGSGPVLAGIDLDLGPGQRLAVVGASGAGKSSLVQLLSGSLLADAGTATLGDTDLASLGNEQIAQHVVVAEQAAHVFDATLGDNLRLARPGATDRELRTACEVAGLGPWVDSLPRGWATPMGERGAQVSGGERTRLSVARAVLSPAWLVLLDEPTEGVDADEADALVRRLAHLPGDRAVVLVTHRLAALEAFDEVVVLDGGRIVQRGTAAGLAQEPGPFLELLRRQTWDGARVLQS